MKYVIKTLKHLWKAPVYTVKMTFAMLCGTVEVIIFYIKQRLFNNSLPNYDIVDMERLHRGGQPSGDGLKELKNKGIKTIITLRTDCDQKWIQDTTSGLLNSVHIPFNPYRPSEEILKRFLMEVKNAKDPVYIHCFHGADRTGMLCAIYRIVIQGWEKEHAISEMKKYGFHWWHKNLIEFIRETDTETLKKEINNL